MIRHMILLYSDMLSFKHDIIEIGSLALHPTLNTSTFIPAQLAFILVNIFCFQLGFFPPSLTNFVPMCPTFY